MESTIKTLYVGPDSLTKFSKRKMVVFLFSLFFLIYSTSACDCVYQTKVAYTNAKALSSGACKYGPLALGFDGRHLAAAVPSLYKSGAGCGACYQIRCQNKKLCNSTGTQVIITDLNQNNQTDFVISKRAFRAMAKEGMDQDLLRLWLVRVKYNRIPCNNNHNLAVRVVEPSQNPRYLAVQFLYQGGMTEIIFVNVIGQPGPLNPQSSSTFMIQNNSAIWYTDQAPLGPLQFQLGVMLGFDPAAITTQIALPANWTVGLIIDTGVQINYTNLEEGCPQCDNGGRK